MPEKITVNIATYSKRKDVLPLALQSLREQTVPVHIRVYYNDYIPEKADFEQQWGDDYTDRGKFYFMGDNEIYFCCDDDLYYPPDYVERTLKGLEEYPECIVTYHGRKLRAKNVDYYKGHDIFAFMNTLKEDSLIDIAGTGVCAFNTKYVKPDILSYPDNKMADVLIGLEAAKLNIPIICLSHDGTWIRAFPVEESIFHSEKNNAVRQAEICNEIIDINQQKQ